MIDALNQYGLLDDVKSRDNFNEVVQNVSAASVQRPNSNLAQAHSLFDTKQTAYNDALMQANPQLAQNRLAFVQQNAPDNQAALAAAQTLVDSVALPPAGGAHVLTVGIDGRFPQQPVVPPRCSSTHTADIIFWVGWATCTMAAFFRVPACASVVQKRPLPPTYTPPVFLGTHTASIISQ
jgi:hypothetical protein